VFRKKVLKKKLSDAKRRTERRKENVFFREKGNFLKPKANFFGLFKRSG
jgi:hypothetical protein